MKFKPDGRLIVPLSSRKKGTPKTKEEQIRYVVQEAYCPNGCSIIDKTLEINGAPGLRFKFRRPGAEGVFVLSAIEGDFDKLVLSGQLEQNVKDDLYCPRCDVMFEKLVNCNCQTDADLIAVGLTPKLDYNNAISFCNVTGCKNGSFIHSGEAIRHVRLMGSI